MSAMKPSRFLLAAAVAALTAGPAMAQLTDNEWQGINSNPDSNDSDDVSDSANWSLGNVPTATDRAVFDFDGVEEDPIPIETGDTAFTPGAINLEAGNNEDGQLVIDKSLVMDQFQTDIGLSSGGSSQDRILVGTETATADSVNIELTGTNPFVFNNDVSWRAYAMDESAVIDLTNSAITIQGATPTANASTGGIGGGVFVENASNTANAEMNFTNPTGTITLGPADDDPSGTLGLNLVQMSVFSTQTWDVDDTGYVYMRYRRGADGSTSGPAVIESADGMRLDNLGELNIVMRGAKGGRRRGQRQCHAPARWNLWQSPLPGR